VALARPELPAEQLAERIGDREFRLFQELIHKRAGIWLSPAKKTLLVGRLSKRLRELGIESFQRYHEMVLADPKEEVRLLDAITTNETHFFREPRHFELLERQILPAFAAGRAPRRMLRVWSAGCSSGEEPYSIAMLLRRHLGAAADVCSEVLATDLSTRVLARAQDAVWPLEKSSEIPKDLLTAYALRGTGTQEGRFRMAPEVRALVRFQRFNLHGDDYGALGSFDLIFCRNVLIYFDAASKARVVERLADRLRPGGYLFVGHAESLNGVTTRLRAVIPTVYSP
jgi:chemotaxis protein methyltransferase CheR